MMRDPAPVLDGTSGECPDAAVYPDAAVCPDAATAATEFLRAYSGGVRALVEMREDVLTRGGEESAPVVTDDDLRRLLASVFSPDVLELRRIDWSSPDAVQRHIIRYEAVHEIADHDELRRRVQPEDRRCYGLFHPAMPDAPVVFAEIALTRGHVASIGDILAPDRDVVRVDSATTAVFYSISSAQPGLRGISFGPGLITRAVEALSAELPRLGEFVTLSPLPGFRRWLTGPAGHDAAPVHLRLPDDELEAGRADAGALRRAAETYLLHTRRDDGRPADAVARFHLGGGATLADIRVGADASPRGWRQSFGVMASYRYERHSQ